MEENASKEKIFDTVFAILKETRTAFIANFVSGFALLLTSFGLLFSYEKIKPILEINIIYILSTLILMAFSIIYSKYLLSIKQKTSNLVKQLEELDYMDKRYFEHYEITTVTFVPMLAATLTMFLVMILVLSWIKFSA